jgi:hypothetical protein
MQGILLVPPKGTDVVIDSAGILFLYPRFFDN